MKLLLLNLILLFSTFAHAEDGSCPGTEAVNAPAPVDMAELKLKIYALSSMAQKNVYRASPTFEKAIENAFDTSQVKTKMEQFYSLLWILGQQLETQKIKTVHFNAASVHDVLIASKVFTDPAIPSQIKSIEFDLSNSNKPKYKVSYTKKGIRLPLNQGKGFYLFRNGKCQHAKELIFEDVFSFEMKRNLGNLMVHHFHGVDLFGDFGNRGFIDVDIEYVSLKSVEFFTGTQNGRVVAYVSREEFNKNKHNALLKLVTKIVPDRSVQPIDW
jgi:hypothetical protein